MRLSSCMLHKSITCHARKGIFPHSSRGENFPGGSPFWYVYMCGRYRSRWVFKYFLTLIGRGNICHCPQRGLQEVWVRRRGGRKLLLKKKAAAWATGLKIVVLVRGDLPVTNYVLKSGSRKTRHWIKA